MVRQTLDLARRLDRVERRLAQRQGARQVLAVQRREQQAEVERLDEEVLLLGQVLAVYQQLGTQLQTTLLAAVEAVVSEGLRAVFGEALRFRLVPAVRAGVLCLDPVLVDPDGTETGLLDARGGGVVAVVGVLLRVLLVRLLADRTRQLLLLDEPFSQLSEEYVRPAAQLLARLARQFAIQIVLVTHQQTFAEVADVVYVVRREATGTVCERLGTRGGSR